MLKKIKEELDWILYRCIDTYYSIYYTFISIPRNIKIILDYIPVLWDNQEYDHAYFEELMLFKLERMYKYFNSDLPMGENHLEKAKEIKFVIECLKINDDWNLDKLHKKHTEKYGELFMTHTPYLNKKDFFEVKFNYSNCLTPEMEEEANEEFRRIRDLEIEIRKENHDLAYNSLRDYIRGWWD